MVDEKSCFQLQPINKKKWSITGMSLNLNFSPVGDTHLIQSDSFLVESEELEYIFENISVVESNIRDLIRNHELIHLQTVRDHRVHIGFWPVRDTSQWTVDIVGPKDGIYEIPERLEEVLSRKEPLPRNPPVSKETSSVSNKEGVKSSSKEAITNRATVWITYAWADNKNHNVDFIAQELQGVGLEVKIDRWNIEAGSRLWEQIEKFIQDEKESGAWIMYATTNSLGSEACKEEYFYALDRALRSRGENYPIIALFPSTVDSQLIPAGIRTRLYVSSSDPDWKERIKAAIERRTPDINKPRIDPYKVRRHNVPGGFLIEIRPRAGSWFPFIVGVPLEEKDVLGKYPMVIPGAPDAPPPPSGGVILSYRGQGEAASKDGRRWWTISPAEEATPTKSFYMFVKELPTCIIFGAENGQKWWVSHYD